MDLDELRKFLVAANMFGYASGNEEARFKEADGSTSIRWSDGPWFYHDNYDGGEPTDGGRIRVCYEDRPFWTMVYFGSVSGFVSVRGPIYDFRMEALRHMPKDAPYRGPRFYESVSCLKYENFWRGEINAFSGYERILDGSSQFYLANYMGGLVNALGFG